MDANRDDELIPGVVAFEHEADLGFDVRAESLPELFHRAAAGMLALIEGAGDWWPDAGAERTEPASARRGTPDSGVTSLAAGHAGSTSADVETPSADGETRTVTLEAGDVAELLAQWLRELLFLYEVEGFAYRDAAFEALSERGLRATVFGQPATRAIREIKGVTYHDLAVRQTDGAWRARVIFDV